MNTWEKVLALGKKELPAWSVEDIALAAHFVRDAPEDSLRSLTGFVDGCLRYVHDPASKRAISAPARDRAAQKLMEPVAHVGVASSVVSVVAALSLSTNHLWQQLSSATLEDLSSYVQPPMFGLLTVVLPRGRLRGGRFCAAHGDEVYVDDETHHCLAVYRDGELQRRIGEGELHARGSVVTGASVFVNDSWAGSVNMYPCAGGARLHSFGQLRGPQGIAMCGGRVYVAECFSAQLSVFTDEGVFVARAGVDTYCRGVAAGADQVFAAEVDGSVAVYRVDTLALERYIGTGILRRSWGVCVSDSVLFVSDAMTRRVLAFDAASGNQLACLGGFEGAPHGVAVRADGTLFVATRRAFGTACCLYAAQLL